MNKGGSHCIWILCQIAQIWWLAPFMAAGEFPVLVGPAMGTTYRITLSADVPGMTLGETHREVEAVLTRIDRAASTWRDDSDASRFNRAAAGEWVPVSRELVTLVEMAREVHAQSDGAFDITVAPLVRLWSGGQGEPSAAMIVEALRCVGMGLIESQPPTADGGAALRKIRAGVEIDLSGIAPGRAVDCLGERLVELGSRSHLVELGGEVRAWGEPAEGRRWRVRLRATDTGKDPPQAIDLTEGAAVATSTCRPGRCPIDPRTGRPVAASRPYRSATVRATCCAMADAWAVAAIVLDVEPDEDGILTIRSQNNEKTEAPKVVAKRDKQ